MDLIKHLIRASLNKLQLAKEGQSTVLTSARSSPLRGPGPKQMNKSYAAVASASET